MAELQGTLEPTGIAASEARTQLFESELKNLQQDLLSSQHRAGGLPAEAYHQFGIAAAAEHRTDDAVAYFKKAVDADPYHARAYTSLGVMYYFKGEEASSKEEKRHFNEEAIKAHQQATEINPNFAKAYSNLGINLYIVGDLLGDPAKFREAIAAEKKAIAADPNYPVSYYNLACIYSLQNNKKEALDWLSEAIEHGYSALGEMQSDQTLDNIRGTKEYKRLERLLASKLGLSD